MKVNDTYLNKTPNQSSRGGVKPAFVVWHETASQHMDAERTIRDWTMLSAAQSSFHDDIAIDGVRWRVLDYDRCAWHAGLRRPGLSATYTVDGRTYTGLGLNQASIGVEVESRADGTPPTPAQWETMVETALLIHRERGIGLERRYHVGHSELTDPGYRSDPAGYSVDELLADARARLAADTNPQVLGLAPGQRECTLPMWLSSWDRNDAPLRGLPVDAQHHLYGECIWAGVEPWLILGMAAVETQMGRTGAGPAHNWLNRKEYNANLPHITINGAMFKRHGNPELGLKRAIIYLADTYGYGFKLSTLSEVIGRWAPPIENDTAAYIAAVRGHRAYILAH